MPTKDIQLFENGSGGEMIIDNQDLSMTETLFQTIYLALFGGNVEANTTGNESSGDDRFDWWGNSLLFSNIRSKQFNSNTERALNNTTLNSRGRSVIETAVLSDLRFLNKVADIDVDVSILSTDKVEITIFLKQAQNIAENQLQFVWSNARNQVIIQKII